MPQRCYRRFAWRDCRRVRCKRTRAKTAGFHRGFDPRVALHKHGPAHFSMRVSSCRGKGTGPHWSDCTFASRRGEWVLFAFRFRVCSSGIGKAESFSWSAVLGPPSQHVVCMFSGGRRMFSLWFRRSFRKDGRPRRCHQAKGGRYLGGVHVSPSLLRLG